MDSMQKSYRLVPGSVSLAVRVEMPHSHADGWAPPEIGRFADNLLRQAPELPRFLSSGVKWLRTPGGGTAWCVVSCERPLEEVEFCYTRASGFWQDRKFNRLPARVEAADGVSGRRYNAELALPPGGASVVFFTATDADGMLASSEHLVLLAAAL